MGNELLYNLISFLTNEFFPYHSTTLLSTYYAYALIVAIVALETV